MYRERTSTCGEEAAIVKHSGSEWSSGIGYAEQDLLRGSVEVTRRNLFGMDRRLSAFARASFRGFRMLGTFREPYLLGRKQELFATAFREDEERDAFDFIRQG